MHWKVIPPKMGIEQVRDTLRGIDYLTRIGSLVGRTPPSLDPVLHRRWPRAYISGREYHFRLRIGINELFGNIPTDRSITAL